MEFLEPHQLRFLPLTPGEVQENRNCLFGLTKGFTSPDFKGSSFVRFNGQFSSFGYFELVHNEDHIKDASNQVTAPHQLRFPYVRGEVFWSSLLLPLDPQQHELIVRDEPKDRFILVRSKHNYSISSVLEAQDLHRVDCEMSGIKEVSREGYLITPGFEQLLRNQLRQYRQGRLRGLEENYYMQIKVDSPTDRRRKILALEFIRTAKHKAGQPSDVRIFEAIAFDMESKRLISFNWVNPFTGTTLQGNQEFPQLSQG